ncbi:MAG: RsmE family RNA methyltransferase [Gammaproteobacteria bacterium]
MREMYLYYPELTNTNDPYLTLPKPMCHRLTTVLRIKPDTPVVFTNGEGLRQRALIRFATSNSATSTPPLSQTAAPNTSRLKRPNSKKTNTPSTLFAERIGSPQMITAPPLIIHYGLALIKGERFEWALQKMTELGVTHITPLITERSEVKLSGTRLEKKTSPWHHELIAALEQSQRDHLPHLFPPTPYETWLQTVTQQCDQRWILNPHDTRKHDDFSMNTRPSTLAIASGPEGGFSDHEVETAMTSGFDALQLGPRILRAETAPLVAITLAQWHWGDYQY